MCRRRVGRYLNLLHALITNVMIRRFADSAPGDLVTIASSVPGQRDRRIDYCKINSIRFLFLCFMKVLEI